ncbi:FliC/FljB family flagellin [Chromohalobacter canadensis]|uniref:Flagellin n=1 Tax=Chromohalobacter canadensis TaxID=141389 RepID=A0ABZ0YB25_9GAMM|nr:FliC/FljB family flagellin [Chromohalobacter canadensis]MCK0768740.1 FliC/FljB family flagellin [Chromohalobacter canadensis]WQH09239.1 FliC/FljB family flagellin [Chromohalobacter canadensis]
MSVINTNITAMIGQQNLSQSQSALSTSMERLSSGLKINSAADDAAGQAIANRMSSQINGLGQAQSNANDGISVAQTTEGALNQVNDNLQRVRELTVQAQNGTNSAEDLSSIQDEIGQRLGEIDRISEETSFNGVDVLASDQEMSIQVGSEDGQTITMNLQEVNSETLGLGDFSVTGQTVNSENFGSTVSDGDTSVTASFDTSDLGPVTDSDTTLGNVSADGGLYEKSNGSGYVALADDGNYYDVDTSDASALTFSSSGTAIDSANVDTSSAVDSVQADVTLDTSSSLDSADLTEINDSEGNGTGEYLQDNGDGTYNMVSIATDGTATAGDEVSVDPLASLDSAISTVDSQRSELGAMQNRFDSAITNLSTTETNLSSARSRIEDADYADEVSNMTRNQILQQAGTSVLSQANQLPQNALSLLG